MPRYAQRIPASHAKTRTPEARKLPRPIVRPPLSHILQLRAAQAARADRAPAGSSAGGLPAPLKSGIERLSGLAMDDVRVHRNSAEPARLGALAYAKGSDIHLGPGQDRHLPHEAWHVVQQKQGRVRPTLQMKNGVPVNDEQALESEADAMGAKALAGGAASLGRETGTTAGAPSQGVIQGKFRFLGVVLEARSFTNNPVPERLLAYYQAQNIYDIRDDWELDFKKPVHLLSAEHVYLLGEYHDRSKWNDQVKEWKGIGKMQEFLKSFPGFEAAKPDPQKQPLESMHAFLLHTSLIARSQLLLLEASKAPTAVVEEILWAAGQILVSKGSYAVLAKAIVEDESDETYEVETNFLEALNAKHFNAVDIAKQVAAKLKTALAVKNPNAAALNEIKDLKALLAGQADTFADLATDLAKVIGIAPASEKGKAVAAEAKSKVAVAHSASAAMGVREEAMAKNIKAAARPLLVKVGDGHVENLGKLLAKTVNVRADKTLADYTKV